MTSCWLLLQVSRSASQTQIKFNMFSANLEPDIRLTNAAGQQVKRKPSLLCFWLTLSMMSGWLQLQVRRANEEQNLFCFLLTLSLMPGWLPLPVSRKNAEQNWFCYSANLEPDVWLATAAGQQDELLGEDPADVAVLFPLHQGWQHGVLSNVFRKFK